ncbi:hypothetical protein [Novosphingobium sp. BL-52-GroH]|uniref:hypothetical protein n=1 Tax=Novosphingobium sp. BL-52-GroH TaxID=3349877 RepID=UPI00384F7C6F
MAYRIAGMPRTAFAKYFGRTAEQLAAMDGKRVVADDDRTVRRSAGRGYLRKNEGVILSGRSSGEIANPHRSAYAIYPLEHSGPPRGDGEGA